MCKFSKIYLLYIFIYMYTKAFLSSFQSLQLYMTLWIAARQASLFITNFWSLLKLMSVESVKPSNHLILCLPFLLLPSVFPSIRVFSNELVLHSRWPEYWEFQLQHQSFQWTPRTDLLEDGLVGSPCNPRDSQESSPTPQFKSVNCSALSFLSHIVQLSHAYMTIGKTIALTKWTFDVNVMSLLFNMPSRLVITFLQGASVF